MADANRVIAKLTEMLGAAQRELAIALVELQEKEDKLMALSIERAEEQEA